MALIRWRIALVVAAAFVVALIAGGIFDRVLGALLLVPAFVGLVAIAVAGRSRLLRVVTLWGSVAIAVSTAVWLSDGSLADATVGVWSGPRRLITTEWPSPVDPQVIATVALFLGVMTALAIELAVRPRWHLAPLIPLLVVFSAVLALGAPLRPRWWWVALLGVLAALLALARHGTTDWRIGRFAASDRTLIGTAIAVIVVVITASGTLAWADRADPRRTEDAEASATLLDPIEAMVALRQADPELDLYRIDDRSTLIGPSLPVRWRLAALDTYDGQRWVPRVTLRPIGGRLGLASPAAPDAVPPVRYDLTLLTDDLDVLPFPGRPLEVDAAVETDLDRVVVRLREAPVPGTVVRAESAVAPTARAATTAAVATRQVDEIAGTFTDRARALAGEGTLFEQLRAIEDEMRTDWALDSSAPGGGQQQALVERFVTDTRRGTREQFVTAFVLLARALGIDARVATGFIIPPDRLETPLTIRSTQATVWPEVRLVGVGWLAFDPVPPNEASNDEEPPPPPEAQSPAAAQPPIAPPVEEGDDIDETELDVDRDAGRWGSVRTWIVRVSTVAGLSALPLVVSVAAILLLKWRRRRRRLRVHQPALRIRGAWANTTDSLVDAGLSIRSSWTDDRIAGSGVPLATATPHEMRRLAAMATAMTFGSLDDAWRLADDAVLTADAVDDAIRAQRTRWERVKWRLSLRSLRRSTRSPIQV